MQRDSALRGVWCSWERHGIAAGKGGVVVGSDGRGLRQRRLRHALDDRGE